MLTRFKTKLAKKTQLTKDVYLLRFDLVEPKELSFQAGQYMISLIPVRRLYSIASSADIKNSFELLIKLIQGGAGSSYLTSLSEGSKILFDGPAGVFSLKENNDKKIFLATGTGIAPIRSIINSKFKILNSKFYLFWGLSKFSDVCLFDELKNFKFQICLSRETSLDQIADEDKKYYHLGRIPTTLDKYWDEIKDGDFYICGNREVVEDLKNYLLEKQIDKSKIHFEKF